MPSRTSPRPKSVLAKAIVHVARRAAGRIDAPVSRRPLEAAVEQLILAPSDRRHATIKTAVAEATAVLLADLVRDEPAREASDPEP